MYLPISKDNAILWNWTTSFKRDQTTGKITLPTEALVSNTVRQLEVFIKIEFGKKCQK